MVPTINLQNEMRYYNKNIITDNKPGMYRSGPFKNQEYTFV